MSKNVKGKNGQKHRDYTKEAGTDAFKTASKRAI